MSKVKCAFLLEVWKKSPLGSSKTLSERDFRRVFLQERRTDKEAQELYHISHHVAYVTKARYRGKYRWELTALRSEHHRAVTLGNKRGKHPPGVLIPKSRLRKMLKQGWSCWRISTELGVSDFLVRRNIEHHGLAVDGHLPSRMSSADYEYLQRLEQFAPGISEAAKDHREDPEKFFSLLYLAFARTTQLLWFIQGMGKSHDYQRSLGRIKKSHICWNRNVGELKLSLALLDYGVPHVRQYRVERKWWVDFAFPGSRLLVEVDGTWHRKDAHTKAQDRRKNLMAKKLGYNLIRVSDTEVAKSLSGVLKRIKDVLASEASAP